MKYRLMKLLGIGLLVFLGIYLLISHDYKLYEQPIGVVTELVNSEEKVETGPSGEAEYYYEQTLQIVVKNGSYKDQAIEVLHQFAQSEINSTKYKKGDAVFLEIQAAKGQINSAAITGLKRDQYFAVVLVIFLFLLLYIAKGLGVLTIVSLLLNISIFVLGIRTYMDSGDLTRIAFFMIIGFVVGTLVILGGITRKSIGAVLSSLCSILVVLGLYYLIHRVSKDLPYETIEFITGHDDVEEIIIISTIMGCLGAVMDVAITMHASISEIVETTPHVSLGDLRNSAKEIGDDIMGTMISVLLFTFISGCIPMMVIEMKNGYSLVTLLRYNITFDVIRFLIGAIGIVVTIPIGTGISMAMEHRKLVKTR